MGIAGLAVRPNRAAELTTILREKDAEYGVTSEVMWKAAKKRRDDIFRYYIDFLFDAIENNLINFHIRFTPIYRYDHSLSGPRKHIDTISKSFYQLLLHRAGRFYSQSCDIHIRPDNGSCTEYLPKMIPGLNSECRSRFNGNHPFKTIMPQDSKNEKLLQLLDVTLGALTSARNETTQSGGVGAYKSSLIDYALNRSGISDITVSDNTNKKNFNVWSVTPKLTK